jgi:hypothetical protein
MIADKIPLFLPLQRGSHADPKNLFWTAVAREPFLDAMRNMTPGYAVPLRSSKAEYH